MLLSISHDPKSDAWVPVHRYPVLTDPDPLDPAADLSSAVLYDPMGA